MKAFFRVVLWGVPVLFGVAFLSLWWAISSTEPLVPQPRNVAASDIEQARRLFQQIKAGGQTHVEQKITISEADVHSLFLLVTRAWPRVSGQALFDVSGGELRASFALPENPMGSYINVRLLLPPSSQGMQVQRMYIGRLMLNDFIFQYLLKWAATRFLGEQQGESILQFVRNFAVHNKALTLTYQASPHMQAKVLAAVGKWQGEAASWLTDTSSIKFYYQQLCRASQIQGSLAQPLARLSSLALKRAAAQQNYAHENQAVLLAMTLFYGTTHIEPLSQLLDLQNLHCARTVIAMSLAGREDLAQHFLYSATLKILSDNRISFAIGEFKELGDSLQGGSGFSFVDLAADQAGIRVASRLAAVANGDVMRGLVKILSKEESFFPDITGLQENLPKHVFELQYGGVNGTLYRTQLLEINKRLDKLPLYR